MNEYKILGWAFLIFGVLGIFVLVFGFVYIGKIMRDTGTAIQGFIFTMFMVIGIIAFGIIFNLGLNLIKKEKKQR